MFGSLVQKCWINDILSFIGYIFLHSKIFMPFIACSSIFAQKPLPIGKVVNIVLYILVHGIRPKLIVNI